MSLEEDILIEKYLKDQLSDDERKDFLEKMANDVTLREKVAFEKQLFETLDENDLEPYGWGLGFRVMMDIENLKGIGSVGEFGWAGAAATYFLVDPKNDLTAVLMTQVLDAENILPKDFVKTIYQNLK